VYQLVDLRLGSRNHSRIVMAGVDVGDSGEAVQVFAPIFIPDFGAAGAVNDDRSQGLHEAGHYLVSIFLDSVRHK